MRVMMLMIPEVYSKPVAPDFQPDPQAIKQMGKYNDSLTKAGVLLSLNGLQPPAAGARVSFAGGKPKVMDGPFAEAKEVLGGYWILEVKSKEEAVEWARRCPAGPGDVIEIRPIFEAGDFQPEFREAAGRRSRDI